MNEIDMKRTLFILIIWLGTLSCLPAWADQVRQLYWDDLVPAHLTTEDPLAKLSQEEHDMAYWVIRTMDTLPPRDPETEEYYEEVDAAIKELEKAGVDISGILAKIRELRMAVVQTLNGQYVRIPGYLLPLEASGGKVTEFLLAPYIGACIHTPPPPPNQIVHVTAARIGGYKISKLFEPVWVTGIITIKSAIKDLFLVDGSAGIEIGYALKAQRIEPYQE